MPHQRVIASEYMQWAKKHTKVKYNLAISGLINYPLAKLPVKIEGLEITGNHYYGYEPLLNAIAKRYDVKIDEIFSTLGTSMANHIAMATMLELGDEVLIEHPTYELLISTAQYLGAKVNRFSRRFENGFLINTDDVKKVVTSKTKLIVITNLHNPSTAHTDHKTLERIGKIARKVGARVLVDEVYMDAMFDKNQRTSFHLGDEFIVTNSLTKVYGLSGLRCGWVFAKPELIQKMYYLNDLFEVNPPYPSELLSVVAFQNLDKIASYSKSLLDTNRKILNDFLSTRNDLEYIQPRYGTVLFPKLKSGEVDKLYDILVKKYDTAVVPGKYFGVDNHFRIGFCGETEILQTGLVNLGKALDELKS